MEYAVEMKGIGQKFDGREVLENISLTIRKGEIFGLLGPSGAGKTTLIKILTGQLKPSDGKALLFGKPVEELRGRDLCRIGIMMDNFGLYERLSCYDNLKLFAGIYGISKERIAEALENVGLLDYRKKAVMNLSKGMRSRLLLARALMPRPLVLFLDEPTSGLDPATAGEIHKLIYMEQEKGTTIFLTTHNMAEAEKLCGHIALLNNGNIVEYGSPKEICRRYNHQKKIVLYLHNGTEERLPHDSTSAKRIGDYLEREEIETIHSTEPNLESVFMELTGRKLE